MRALRVGFDVDEVLYRWWRAFAHYLHTVEGWPLDRLTAPLAYEFFRQWGMKDRKEFLTLAGRAARSGILHSHGEPLGGASDILRGLMDAGHTVHVITARGEGRDGATRRATAEWFERWGIPYTTLDFSADKTIVPTDVYLDDKLSNVDEVTAAGTLGVVMDTPHNQDPDCRRTRVSSLAEYAALVQELATAPVEARAA